MTHPWVPLYSCNKIANQTVWGIYGLVGFLQTRTSPQSNYLTSGTNRNMLDGVMAGIRKMRVYKCCLRILVLSLPKEKTA